MTPRQRQDLRSRRWSLRVERDARSMHVSPPPSPPHDDSAGWSAAHGDAEIFDDDVTVLAIMYSLASNVSIQQQLLLLLVLNTMIATVTIMLAAFIANPGYRPYWGTRWVKREGETEHAAVRRMMKPASEGGNPEQFRRYFRMRPSTFIKLENVLWEYTRAVKEEGKKRDRRNRNVHELRLLMTIDYLASGDSLLKIGRQWDHPTLDARSLLINELAALRDVFIRWPEGAEFDEVCREFSKLRAKYSNDQEKGFSRCCGAIDGTFIKILQPHQYTYDAGTEHNCYKCYYAIQLLAVCIPNFKIIYAHTGAPGSWADTSILKTTDLWQNTESYIPLGAFLLGDGGFTLLTWLMTPFSKLVNKIRCPWYRRMHAVWDSAQKSSRVCIEQTFGILKGRWRILRHGIQAHHPSVTPILEACIVLHNICIDEDDLWWHEGSLDPEPTDKDTGTTGPNTFTLVGAPGAPSSMHEHRRERGKAERKLAEDRRVEIMLTLAPFLTGKWREARDERLGRARPQASESQPEEQAEEEEEEEEEEQEEEEAVFESGIPVVSDEEYMDED